MEVVKVSTGTPGLDHILRGGIRKDTTLLITGAPGTGKTLLALQFLCKGVKDHEENGIIITAEETPESLRSYAEGVGLDFAKYEKEGKILVIEKPVTYLRGGISSIRGLINIIKQRKIKRMVLDSLTFFEYLYPKNQFNDIDFRRQVLLFTQEIKKEGVTLVATAERAVTDLDHFNYMMMDFLFDAFVLLTRIRKGSYFERAITVIKVKGQDHSLDIYPISITKDGVQVLYDQVPFSLVEQDEEKRSGKR